MIGSPRRVKNSSCVCGQAVQVLYSSWKDSVRVMDSMRPEKMHSGSGKCRWPRNGSLYLPETCTKKNENSHLPSPQIICTPRALAAPPWPLTTTSSQMKILIGQSISTCSRNRERHSSTCLKTKDLPFQDPNLKGLSVLALSFLSVTRPP